MLGPSDVFGSLPPAAPAPGLVWVIGRVFDMTSSMRDPDKRDPGFGISALAEILLPVLALIGIAMAWTTAA